MTVVNKIEGWADSPHPMKDIQRHYKREANSAAMLDLADEVDQALGDSAQWYLENSRNKRFHIGDTVRFKNEEYRVKALDPTGYLILETSNGPLWANVNRCSLVEKVDQ